MVCEMHYSCWNQVPRKLIWKVARNSCQEQSPRPNIEGVINVSFSSWRSQSPIYSMDINCVHEQHMARRLIGLYQRLCASAVGTPLLRHPSRFIHFIPSNKPNPVLRALFSSAAQSLSPILRLPIHPSPQTIPQCDQRQQDWPALRSPKERFVHIAVTLFKPSNVSGILCRTRTQILS
jgi:hypothetical protein